MITDVIIVGSGFAGLAAAIEAYDAGATVVVVEKRLVPGGNSMIAYGSVNAVDPKRQKPQGIKDSVELHYKHTLEGGDFIADEKRVRYMVEHALDCIHWFENFGVSWPDRVIWGYGAMWPRTHGAPAYGKYKRGAALIHAHLDQLKKRGVPILLNHKVSKILRENPFDGDITGVEVEAKDEKLRILAKRAIVLASGGFAANLQWVVTHDPRLSVTDTTNHPEATGECIKLAQDIGAATVHMDYIQCVIKRVKAPFKAMGLLISDSNPSIPHPGIPYRIIVNKDGERIVSEDARRVDITHALLEQPLFDPCLSSEANSLEELEKSFHISTGNLVDTIERYNQCCTKRCDSDFGKHIPVLAPIEVPPFKAESIAVARHHTMGGLRVAGTTGQVIDRWEKAIPRLYAAGEVTGGLHGTNRLGNNAIPDCIVFGRLCGRNAAEAPRDKPL